jgi:hypothetical protein
MAEAEAEKYVVVSTMVNDWPQGTVIDRKALRVAEGFDAYGRKSTQLHTNEPTPAHDQLERLLALGAIRPAAEHEAALARVPVPQGGLSTEAQLRLGQQDAQLEQLTRQVAALGERLAFHRAANPVAPGVAPEEDPATAGAIAERQAKVDHMVRLVGEMQAQLDEAQGQTAAADEARAKAAHEARGGRDLPTGQAGAGALASLGPPGEQHAGAGAGEAGPSSPAPSPPPSPPPGAERVSAPRRGRPPRQAEPTPAETPKESEPGAGEPLFPPKE